METEKIETVECEACGKMFPRSEIVNMEERGEELYKIFWGDCGWPEEYNPGPYFWGDWLCPDCLEMGEAILHNLWRADIYMGCITPTLAELIRADFEDREIWILDTGVHKYADNVYIGTEEECLRQALDDNKMKKLPENWELIEIKDIIA